jgi:DNA polymerase III alpha subunit
VRVLIKAGCFDSIAHGLSRPALLWKALRFFDTPSASSSLNLFEPDTSQSHSLSSPVRQNPSSLPYSKSLMLKHELETLGFYLSIHPLDRYRERLKGLSYVQARDLHLHVGKQVTMVGWLVTGKTVHTREGDPMKFVSFEDTTGLYEAVFFPKVYHRFCHMLNEMRPYMIRGKVEEDFGAITLTVHWIEFMDKPDRGAKTRNQNSRSRLLTQNA